MGRKEGVRRVWCVELGEVCEEEGCERRGGCEEEGGVRKRGV